MACSHGMAAIPDHPGGTCIKEYTLEDETKMDPEYTTGW